MRRIKTWSTQYLGWYIWKMRSLRGIDTRLQTASLAQVTYTETDLFASKADL